MWLLAAFFLLLFTGLAIFWPYLRPQAALDSGTDLDPRLAELYDQRDMLYRAIRDARLDMETGKLSAADFEQHEAGLKRQAADVLRSIDEVEGELLSPQLDAKMEAEIAAVRTARGSDDGADYNAAIEASIAAARRSGKNGAAVAPAGASSDRFCGHCGGPLQVGNRFCGKCGQAVRAS